MSERKHTPGEWEIIGDDECPAGVPVIEISAGGGSRLVAYVQPDGDDGKDFSLTDEDRANAAIIASAPALLAALEESFAVHCELGLDEESDLYQMLSAAIASATLTEGE